MTDRNPAQLIGYSVSGWGGLSYVREEDADREQAKVDVMIAERKVP